MFVVIETGGKQYRVREGDIIDVEKLDAGVDETVEIDQVLAVYDDEGRLHTGTPYLDGVSARVRVVDQTKGPKITVFKYKPKTKYRRKIGHRQRYTRIKVEGIEGVA